MKFITLFISLVARDSIDTMETESMINLSPRAIMAALSGAMAKTIPTSLSKRSKN